MSATRLSAQSWPDRAACRGQDTERWFPVSPSVPPEPFVVAACAGCPVRPDCLDYALSVPVKEGYWGGLTEDERGLERRRRMRRGEVAA